MSFFSKIFYLLKKPSFIIFVLSYYILIFGSNVLFDIDILNIFTLFFVPFTTILLLILYNLFYNEKLNIITKDNEIKEKYFSNLSKDNQKKVLKLFNLKDEIEKLGKKINLNEIKENLVSSLLSIDLYDLIDKYANNYIKLEFIDDFLAKKSNIESPSIKEKINKLKELKNNYEKLNREIYETFETIHTQLAILLTDDISKRVSSRESIEEIQNKIKTLDNTNSKINEFYDTLK
ncbi:MAG TPA: hypothetical protein PLE45_07190 [Spirochaetota bacterium]|nr:hypothetical protein [Spirochaetota bacterium]HOL57682.1 hypothetical protein [Spirochaetota bacterium]HPP04550.1 hypothetical protein [Spirochaetota bacterium]